MPRTPTLRHLVLLLPAITALAAVAKAAGTVQAASQHPAHLARALNVTDTAHLHFVRENADSTLTEEGTATGKLPGKVKVRLSIEGNVAGSFTITTHQGSLTGHSTGTLHSSGQYASFRGSVNINHGTGSYAHAHGHGGFYGTINRSTYAMTVQTTGTLAF
jgi:hypothetical protein